MKRWVFLLFMLFTLMETSSVFPGETLSPGEAISIAESRYEGKVLSSQLVRTGIGKGYYRIKMISNGKIRTVQIDASKK